MSVEEIVADAVEAAVTRALRPLEARLAEPAPMTYSAHQAAVVIGCSERTVYGLVESGRLPVVPHLGKKVAIPRVAVEQLIHANVPAALQVAS